MKKLNRRTPVVFHVGLVILCMVLISTYLTGGLYARYTSSDSSSDSARVAKFDIKNQITSHVVDLELHFFDSAKSSASLPFSVTSGSEVSVKYDVVVNMPALPDGYNYDWLEVNLNGQILPPQSENIFTFSEVGKFAPNDDSTHEYVLTLTIRSEYLGMPPAGLNDLENGGVAITVHAEQID